MTLSDPFTGEPPAPGMIVKVRTARVEHDCNLAMGCVIHPGERYVDSVIPPWVLVADDVDDEGRSVGAPCGEWYRSRYHANGQHNRDGMLDLFHRTTPEALEEIKRMGRMVSREQRKVFFSNRRDGQATGFGPVIIHVQVPRAWAELEDEFPDGEMHYSVLDTRVSTRAFLPDSEGV